MKISEVFLLLIIGGLLWYIKKLNDKEEAVIARKFNSTDELKRTISMGLHYRFNYPKVKNEEEEMVYEDSTNIFIKQNHFEFEDFVAQIFKRKYEGNVFVTNRTGDFGVDFELNNEDGLYLGQAKVKKDDLDFTPIALIHSNMIKDGAKGGYVITTSDFTLSARRYAEGLDIELINGIQLATYWLETLDYTIYEPKE